MDVEVEEERQAAQASMLTLRCKVLVLGNATVGKSSLIQMFHSDGKLFPKSYLMTVGVEFCVKSVCIPNRDNVAVELYIFDLSGQEIYRDLVKKHMEGVGMVVLCYDSTSKKSKDSLADWIAAVQPFFPHEVLQGVLVATKSDLEARTVVTAQEGTAFAKHHNVVFFQTSAKENRDVDAPFNFIANKWYQMYEESLEEFAK